MHRTLLPLLASLFAIAAASQLPAAETPNIIVILADDLGYGSLGCYGADPKLLQTPHLDRLAREGRRFTDANTTSSVCSPTRYSVLTGRYCWRTSEKSGVLGVFSPLHIEPTRLNLASLLKAEGYHTAAIGKWHLGYGATDGSPKWRTDYTAELSPGPLDIGFDYHFSVPANHGDVTGVFVENRFVYGLRSANLPSVPESADFKNTYTPEDLENPRPGIAILDLDAPRRVNERVMPVLTDKAVGWIEQQTDQTPFFLYYTPVAAHNPITPSAETAGTSAAGSYGDWIHEIDRSVGAILDTLERKGLADNTLVIFTSDNGGVTGSKDPDSPQGRAEQAGLKINGDLRGRKHSVWEGGFKVPFLVRWPGHATPGSVSDEMVSLVDLLATTASIVGKSLPPASEGAEDSVSILPAILGETAQPLRSDLIVHSSDGVYAIRKGPWKWIEGVPVEETKPNVRRMRADEFQPQLYDTSADPDETTNVSDAHPEIVAELSALLDRYRDGGYSRELPPMAAKPAAPASFGTPSGTLLLDEALVAMPGTPWKSVSGKWTAQEDALWGVQTEEASNGATLRVPLELRDGVVQYELCFRGANRHSLRIENAGKTASFRIEVSRAKLGITKNPASGEGKDKTEPLATQKIDLQSETWYPLRLTFRGEELIAEIAGVTAKASHPVLGETKGALNFLVFGETIGFRRVQVAQP